MTNNRMIESDHKSWTFKMESVVQVEVEKREDKCNFCHKSKIDNMNYGPMYKLDGITAHYFCILFSTGGKQYGKDDEGILGFLPADIRKDLQNGKSVECTYCGKMGATIKCFKAIDKRGPSCPKRFHFPCGIEHGTHHKFQGNFASFCPDHKPQYVTRVPKYVKQNIDGWECEICMDKIEQDQPQIWAKCCKRGVFHKECIKNHALVAGRYQLKCPLCRCKHRFLKNVEMSGVFVPQKDAEWEQEPGAYENMSIKLSCEAKNLCQCPYGVLFNAEDEGDWSLRYCFGCGGFASHFVCANRNLKWMCDLCKSLISEEKAQEIADEMIIDRPPPTASEAMKTKFIECLVDENLEDYLTLANAQSSAYYSCDPNYPTVKYFGNPNKSQIQPKWYNYGDDNGVMFRKLRTEQGRDDNINRLVVRIKPGFKINDQEVCKVTRALSCKTAVYDYPDIDSDIMANSSPSCCLMAFLVIKSEVRLRASKIKKPMENELQNSIDTWNVEQFGQICIPGGTSFELENVTVDEQVELYCILKLNVSTEQTLSSVSCILPISLIWYGQHQCSGLIRCGVRIPEGKSYRGNKWMIVIYPRTVAPIEENKLAAMLIMVLHGTVRVKSTNFKITEQGDPCLLAVSLDAGSHAEIPYGSRYSLENWTDEQVVLLSELI